MPEDGTGWATTMVLSAAEKKRTAATEYATLIASYSYAARRYYEVGPEMRRMLAGQAAQAARALHAHFQRPPQPTRWRAMYDNAWCYIAEQWEARQ